MARMHAGRKQRARKAQQEAEAQQELDDREGNQVVCRLPPLPTGPSAGVHRLAVYPDPPLETMPVRRGPPSPRPAMLESQCPVEHDSEHASLTGGPGRPGTVDSDRDASVANVRVATLRISDIPDAVASSGGESHGLLTANVRAADVRVSDIPDAIAASEGGSQGSSATSGSGTTSKSSKRGGTFKLKHCSLDCCDHECPRAEQSLPNGSVFLQSGMTLGTAVFVQAALQQESAMRDAELAQADLGCHGRAEERCNPNIALERAVPAKPELETLKELPLDESVTEQQELPVDQECTLLSTLKQDLEQHEDYLIRAAQQIDEQLQALSSETCDPGREEPFRDAEVQTLAATREASPDEPVPGGPRELAERWVSLRRGQLEVQRQREELSEKLSELQGRLECARQQQADAEQEKDKFESRWENYNERWHSLRAHQLELEQDKASIQKQRDEIDAQWVELRSEQEAAQKDLESISERRECFEAMEASLQRKQSEIASTEAFLECQREQVHEAVQNTKRKSEQVSKVEAELKYQQEHLREADKNAERRSEQISKVEAELEAEKANLQRLKDQLRKALSDASANSMKAKASQVPIPSYWTGKPFHIRVPWFEGAQPILTMLQRGVVHRACDGRDGLFCIQEIRHVKVWRVENDVLWKRYVGKMDEVQMLHRKRKINCRALHPPVKNLCDGSFPECLQWQDAFNKSCNEVLLWHGTRREHVETICKAGMDERVCNLNGMFGAGLYFAEDSCKSGQYAMRDSSGSSWFLLCRVILGNPHSADQGMPQTRRPPDLCDSVVYHPSGLAPGFHRELVVYDRAQVYPEYVIEACRG